MTGQPPGPKEAARDGPRVSVIITTRNEAKRIRHLLDSLIPQEHLHEVIVVDAASTDGTASIAQGYAGRLPLHVHSEPCTRGRGRNLAAARATGDLLVFIDADCMANVRWMHELVSAWDGRPDRIVAGHTEQFGYWAFTRLNRVELAHKGQDTTWPSCNLAYSAALFGRIGGFDESFVTAEDIDLNLRAVSAGAEIAQCHEAIVYAQARDSIGGFLRQAYWNGYGRKQLTEKHGRLWRHYKPTRMLRNQGGSLWGTVRIVAGLCGYLAAKFARSRSRSPG
jgi:glycosyltransferase involved in cell wall biosynthesis